MPWALLNVHSITHVFCNELLGANQHAYQGREQTMPLIPLNLLVIDDIIGKQTQFCFAVCYIKWVVYPVFVALSSV